MNLTIGTINVFPMLLSGHENIQPFGFLNIALGLLILTGWIRVYLKARKLKKNSCCMNKLFLQKRFLTDAHYMRIMVAVNFGKDTCHFED